MRSVFERYRTLIPAASVTLLEPLLTRVRAVTFPEERKYLAECNPSNTVVVIKSADVRELIGLIELGFEHLVQSEREDFAQELLASCLMLLRPESFMRDPVNFFANGFQTGEAPNPDHNLFLKFHASSAKGTLLEWLASFLAATPQTDSLREMCLHAADDLITNALYNAPVKLGGRRPHQDLPRDVPVEVPLSHQATLFACRSERRVIIGCLDQYGSLEKESLVVHLRQAFKETAPKIKDGQAGTGLGFRNLVSNAAGLYVLSSKGRLTLVASAFALKGLRANLTATKHLHFSFRQT